MLLCTHISTHPRPPSCVTGQRHCQLPPPPRRPPPWRSMPQADRRRSGGGAPSEVDVVCTRTGAHPLRHVRQPGRVGRGRTPRCWPVGRPLLARSPLSWATVSNCPIGVYRSAIEGVELVRLTNICNNWGHDSKVHDVHRVRHKVLRPRRYQVLLVALSAARLLPAHPCREGSQVTTPNETSFLREAMDELIAEEGGTRRRQRCNSTTLGLGPHTREEILAYERSQQKGTQP